LRSWQVLYSLLLVLLWYLVLLIDTLKYEFWWIMLITSTIVLFVNWGIFKQFEHKYFPIESEETSKYISKHERLSKICFFILIAGAFMAAISLIVISYILGIFSTEELKTPFFSNLGFFLRLLIYIGSGMVFVAFLMIIVGALDTIEAKEKGT